jgi:MoaA/NifB/PqqE/SkfB family radical SAM enzyme
MRPTGDHAIVQLHPTRRCNLQCLHCYSSSGPGVDESTPLPVLQHALEDAVALGYDVVGISGGEPLLYRQLTELLRTAKGLGLRTTVTSNGIALTERRLGELAGLVDVLAVSLDGAPKTHNMMRNDPRAFERLNGRLAGVAASGIPFGIITTLTFHNVQELEFVVAYAKAHRASLVQVHPLEAEGAAVENLGGSLPDDQEMAFALLEAARLSQLHSIPVQVDVVLRSDLEQGPARFFAEDPRSSDGLVDWLSPLVIETDGTVVPVSYGFARRFALGTLHEARLRDLATGWDASEFVSLCAETRDRLLATDHELFSWYDELSAAARATPVPLPARSS